jgi:hypothetical protein
MVDRPLPGSGYDDLRPGPPGRQTPPGRVPERERLEGPGRPRIPSPGQLAKLLINGILTLPRNYRRGMFLDIWV